MLCRFLCKYTSQIGQLLTSDELDFDMRSHKGHGMLSFSLWGYVSAHVHVCGSQRLLWGVHHILRHRLLLNLNIVDLCSQVGFITVIQHTDLNITRYSSHKTQRKHLTSLTYIYKRNTQQRNRKSFPLFNKGRLWKTSQLHTPSWKTRLSFQLNIWPQIFTTSTQYFMGFLREQN